MPLTTIERIQAMIHKEQWSVQQAARALDLNATTLAHYLSGQRNPSRFVRLYLDQAGKIHRAGGTEKLREFVREYLN